jgi:alcohol dehydrogenase YqhD (iron-dependent ADH family)
MKENLKSCEDQYEKRLWNSKMKTQHVPLRQSVEGIVDMFVKLKDEYTKCDTYIPFKNLLLKSQTWLLTLQGVKKKNMYPIFDVLV